MAFPQVAATNTHSQDTDVTSHTVNLPANISSGHRLLILFSKDGSPNDATFPLGWTSRVNSQMETSTGRLYVLERIANGTEGSTIEVTTTAAERSCSITYRITGAHASEAVAAAVAVGIDATLMDPPALSPVWGAEDTLWIIAAGVNESETFSGTGPLGYGNPLSVFQTGIGEVNVGSVRRELNALSEDPGTWAWNVIGNPFAVATLAVRASSGPPAVALQRPVRARSPTFWI